MQIVPELKRSIHPYRDAMAYRAIRRQLQAFRPDVVHTHSAKGGILGRQAAWSLGVPVIIHTVHGAPFHQYQSKLVHAFYRYCERRAAKQCHKLVCVADAMRDLVVQAGVASPEQCVTVYSGMRVEPFLDACKHRDRIRNQLGIQSDDVVIGKVARLFELKGHDDVISAAELLIKENDKLKFLFVGDGLWRKRLEARIESLGLKRHFVFVGLIPPEDVPQYFGAMDVLVHCSLREGLARALPQALIAGIPVISYDIDGAREVVLPEATGILLKPQDIRGLAQGIARLACDASLRERWGGEGRRKFTRQFDHREMTRILRDLYLHVG